MQTLDPDAIRMASKQIGDLCSRLYGMKVGTDARYGAVFVTGNANKLREVRAVLGADKDPKFTLTNQDFDRM